MKSHPPRSRSSRESSGQRRKWATVGWVALFSLPLLWVQTQQSLAVCPPTCGIAYTVDSTGDGHNVGPVTQCNDGTNHCTLRAAIEASNGHAGDDGIFFDIPTTDPNFNGIFWTIRLGTALPDLSTNINITGPGADKLTVQRSTVNGTPVFPIFNVTTTGLVALSGMTIRNGIAAASGTFGVPATGGGIAHNASGTLNVANCILTANSAGNGGGIGNFGAMTVTDCTLSGNSASNVGGGIYSEGGTASVSNCTLSGNSSLPPSTNSTVYGGGLGIVGAGTVNVTNCALSGNQACGNCGGLGGSSGSAGLGGGIYIESNGTVNVTNCSLGSNSVGYNTGSVIARGGGICIQSGVVNIINSTLGGNFGSKNGGGIYNEATTLNVTNCTLSSNSAQFGGGIFNPAGKTANVKSSIIALNTAGGSAGPDLNGTFIAQGFNLIGNNDGAAASFPAGNPNANNDIVGTSASPIDPKLDPNGLQNNGGPTQTIALLSGSPAIDKGTSLGSTGTLTTDQRGAGRTLDDPSVANAAGGDGTDVGAFEFGATLRLISITRNASDIIITFQAGQGVTYRLERKLNITDAQWQSISGVNDLTPSSNGPAPITDPGAVSLGKSFYRVRLL